MVCKGGNGKPCILARLWVFNGQSLKVPLNVSTSSQNLSIRVEYHVPLLIYLGSASGATSRQTPSFVFRT